MATISLVPNADVSNDWTQSSIGDVYALLNNTAVTLAGDMSYLSSTSAGSSCIVDLQDFTEAHSAINSVTLTTVSGNAGRGQRHTLETRLTSAGGDYYTESSGSIPAHRFNYITTNYTTRTTHNGSDAWTAALLNALRVRVDLDAHSGGTTQFTYLKIEVDYDLPVATDNAIFFGANF
jgi:hypothetical protein